MSRAGTLLLVAALAVGGDACTKTASCKPGTLFVTVRLDAGSAAADTLHVSVVLAGGQTWAGSGARGSTASSGTVEIDFPAGSYPAGQSATITVDALAAGNVVGTGSSPIASLPAGCATATVDVQSTTGGDMGGDGGTGDMSMGHVFALRAAISYADGPATGVPYSAAIGDLTGDGKNDIVVTNDAAGVAVLVNNGDGTFAMPALYQANQHPQAVALGDLNGDGKTDVVVADSMSNDVIVYFNNGTGTITQSMAYAVGMQPGDNGADAVVIRDFNGDGKNDIAVAAANGANVLLNMGNGVFPQTAAVYAAGTRPAGIASADFNGDGKPDLVVANGGSPNVSVFLNKGDGSGTFNAAVNYATTGTSPVNVDVGDLNGDGKPDIAVATLQGAGGVTVFLNKGDGSGTFPTTVNVDANDPGPTGVAIGDIDGDGKNDVVIANNNNGLVYVVRNLGGNMFDVPQRWAVGAFAYDVHIGDLGNGHPDIVATNGGSGDTTVVLNDGKGNLVAAANYPSGPGSMSVAAVDVNKDGNADLVLADNGSSSSAGTAAVMLGKGDGTFQPVATYGAGTKPVAVVATDFDGDGWIDMALANAGMGATAGNLTVLLNKKDGTFATAVPYTPGTTPSALAFGDLTGDGKPELVVANGGSNNVSVFVNKGDGTGTFTGPTNYGAGMAPSAVAVGNVDQNMLADVVVANGGSGNLTVLINDGTGALVTPTTIPVGMTPASVLIVDLDGDGHNDLVVRDAGLANVDVLKGNGNGTFGMPVAYPVDDGALTNTVIAADIDGDGHLDLIATDARSQLSILLGKGDGTFKPRIAYAAGEAPSGVAVADFNKDGKLDALVANTAYGLNGGVSILLNVSR